MHNIIKVENKLKVQLGSVGEKKSKLIISLGNILVDVLKVRISTFKMVEKKMDISRTQTLRLKKILRKDLVLENGLR